MKPEGQDIEERPRPEPGVRFPPERPDLRSHMLERDPEYGSQEHQREFLIRMARAQRLNPCPKDHEHHTSCYPQVGGRMIGSDAQDDATGPRCAKCNRFKITSDGVNYDPACVCGHRHAGGT